MKHNPRFSVINFEFICCFYFDGHGMTEKFCDVNFYKFHTKLSKLDFLVAFVCTLQGKCDSLSHVLEYDFLKPMNHFGHRMTEKFYIDNF